MNDRLCLHFGKAVGKGEETKKKKIGIYYKNVKKKKKKQNIKQNKE